MKINNLMKKLLVTSILINSSVLVGCASRESIVTREITQEGSSSVQNTVIQEYKGPGQRKIIERQVVSENLKCVGNNGRKIPAKTIEECIGKKGKVIDEVIIEEEQIRR